MLIISILIPLVDNTFYLQLYEMDSVPVVSIMFHQTLTIWLTETN